ncbi:MAG: hypothetical protein K2X38_16805 [Gemmataceae bacterium]|nr:hypothetical protein [Gemmataceae bacterium]
MDLRRVPLALMALLLPLAAHASKVKSWNHGTASSFEKAKLSKTVVSSQGVVRLSREVKLLANLDATHVWDLAEDANGVLYAATGKEDGKIYRIGKDGAAASVLTMKDTQILSLAIAADGSLFAGVGPGGKIVRIDAKGTTSTIGENLGSYVWSLVADPATGAVFAGTGPKGTIYRIGADLKAEPYYVTKQDHVLTLAVGAGGALYAGVDKEGLVYRIDAKNKGFVVYDATQSEVRTLAADDAIYAGTSAPGTRKIPSGFKPPTLPLSGTGTSGTGTTPSSKTPDGEPETAPKKTKAATGPLGSFGSDDTKGIGASAPSSPSSSENSVYRIGKDGSVREVFREKAMVLRLLRLKDRLLIGTGMQGQLFEVHEETKEKAEIARLDHGQILSMLKRRDGSVVLGTGDPGKIYVLENRYAARGTLVSDVLDAKLTSHWGSLHWASETPAGTTSSMAVRAGNVADPDDTWSDWSAEQTDPAAAFAKAPTARYLQYRVTLTTKSPDATPELRQIVVRYKTTNQAPEITSLDVPDLDATALDSPKKLKLKWAAVDPNEDELNYRLYVRKKEWTDWVLLEENLEKKDYDWDPATMPSGHYQAKVVASDRRDNAPEDALTAEKVSGWIAVSNEPPAVAAKVANINGTHATIDVAATGSLVRLVEASYAIDGSRWSSAFPADGLFDSKQESLRIRTESLRPGTHVMVVRVKDAAGNVGSADAVFRIAEKQ